MRGRLGRRRHDRVLIEYTCCVLLVTNFGVVSPANSRLLVIEDTNAPRVLDACILCSARKRAHKAKENSRHLHASTSRVHIRVGAVSHFGQVRVVCRTARRRGCDPSIGPIITVTILSTRRAPPRLRPSSSPRTHSPARTGSSVPYCSRVDNPLTAIVLHSGHQRLAVQTGIHQCPCRKHGSMECFLCHVMYGIVLNVC